MRIKYSPEARDKLCQMKKDEGIKRVSLIMKGIRNLSDYPRQCPTIEMVLGIPSSYYFIQKMFGISLRTSESLEFWGE